MVLRGPDERGTWFEPDGSVALGHRRLSILDLSRTGTQPMQDLSGRWVLTFNGEIYNFRELRTRLEQSGTVFQGTSDTEVLIEAIASWGVEKTLNSSNGMFAFAVWDRKKKRLYLARDRFGEKPLYYARVNGAFIFASELKPLFLFPQFTEEIDKNALDHFLRLSYVPAPSTIFRGVYKVKPGHVLEISSADRIQEKCYWNPEEQADQSLKQPFSGTFAEAVPELERLLMKSVELRSVSDVPLGCFLSGGIDSSLITAMMSRVSKGQVSTFSIGFKQAGFDEAVYARRVANHLGTHHTELYLSEHDILDVIPRIPSMFDEPFGDSSQIPSFLVAEMARKAVTVCLSGDAGDELFGGYTRYLQGPAQSKTFNRIPGPLRSMGAGVMQAFSPRTWDAMHRFLSPVLPDKFKVLHFGEKLQKLARAVKQAHSPEYFYMNLIHQVPLSSPSLVRQFPNSITDPVWNKDWPMLHNMMIQDTMQYLPGDILTKVDRASMGVSLEARVPFLDPDLFRFAWSLPDQFKIRHGKGKWILRELLKQYVPEDMFERPKSGFAMPVAQWLRGPLRGWAEDLLPRENGHDLLDGRSIHHLWQTHLKGNRDHNAILWNLLMFRAWEKQWVEPHR